MAPRSRQVDRVTATASDLVSAADIDAAARRRGVSIRTPSFRRRSSVRHLAEAGNAPTGGAFWASWRYGTFLSRLDPAVRRRGVVAPSSGNHAQAVALAAKLLGAPAIVVMPTTVTAAKRSGAERLGARVELAGTTTADRMARALEIVEQEGATLVPPYDDPLIIAGQGTVGLEIVQDLPDVAMVLVPVGGGGLSTGVAAAVKLHKPKARVIGVEPEGAPEAIAGAPGRLSRQTGQDGEHR